MKEKIGNVSKTKILMKYNYFHSFFLEFQVDFVVFCFFSLNFANTAISFSYRVNQSDILHEPIPVPSLHDIFIS